MNIKKLFPKLNKEIINNPITASTINYLPIKKMLNNIKKR